MRKMLGIAGSICVLVVVAIALPVMADGWWEKDKHHNSTPSGDYHAHAHVKAWAYMGGDSQCHYNQWQHDYGDTWTLGYYTHSYYGWHDTESGYTDTYIYYLGGLYDQETATLPDFTYYCPA